MVPLLCPAEGGVIGSEEKLRAAGEAPPESARSEGAVEPYELGWEVEPDAAVAARPMHACASAAGRVGCAIADEGS